jgi:hypothetical protein
MMMTFGLFVFSLSTTAYQQLQQSIEWRHVKNERVNRSASRQYTGAGDNKITLNGTLYPEITGGNLSLAALTTTGFAGKPWPLIEGSGTIYGMFVLTGIQTGHTEFDRYGNARKIEFTLSLERADEDIREKLQNSSVTDLLGELQEKATGAINNIGGSLSGLL